MELDCLALIVASPVRSLCRCCHALFEGIRDGEANVVYNRGASQLMRNESPAVT
jgi:hypothetical protein